jgi:hypothetical protein
VQAVIIGGHCRNKGNLLCKTVKTLIRTWEYAIVLTNPAQGRAAAANVSRITGVWENFRHAILQQSRRELTTGLLNISKA